MSDAVIEAPPQPSALRLIATLGGIAVVSGLLVVGTYQLTKPRIEENKRVALERAVFSVLPGAAERTEIELSSGETVIAALDQAGNLIGYALSGEARGYQDVIRLLYGYDAERQRIVGLTILQSTETPGLGDKIIRDPRFRANFTALDVSRPVEVVKEGEKTEAWHIDGISGATVSSNAVGEAIRRGAPLREAVRAHGPADPTDPTDPTDPSHQVEQGATP